MAADDFASAEEDSTRSWKHVRADIKGRIRNRLNDVRLSPQDAQTSSLIQQEIRALRIDAKSVDRRTLTKDFCARTSSNVLFQLRNAEEKESRAIEHFNRCFTTATARSSGFASELARNDRFREAVNWQNPQVVSTALDVLAEANAASVSRSRRSEELVASYAQRYCTKNDTIGFFGPVGWAKFVSNDKPIWMCPGTQLLSKRSVYFEDWPIQAIATRLSADPDLRPWLTPRRMPHLRLDGPLLHLPGGSHIRLGHDEAAVLRACDGILTSRQIAMSLRANPFLNLDAETDVYSIMERLARNHRISWEFAVRVGDPWPERHLRDQIAVIDDRALQEAAVSGLDAMEAAKADLASAAGCAQRVAEAVSRMNTVFEKVSGTDATRRAGETYGARTVVYEDCERDMRVELGQKFVSWLQPSLDLVLASARWYCNGLGQLFREEFWQIFQSNSVVHQDTGRRSVDLPTFWFHAQALFFGSEPLNADSVQDELTAKWERILEIPSHSSSVQYASEDLFLKIGDAFDAPDCGWRSACHQSPDVMIAASSVDSISRGEGLFVLGEVHLGINTLINHSAVNQFPEPRALLSMLRADRGAPRVIPLLSRGGTQQPIRVQTVAEFGYDIELCFSHDARPLNGDTALNIADLIVEEAGGALLVRTLDQSRSFDLMNVFGELLSGYAANKFRILKPASYRPRLAIDSLVVQRQAWRFRCGDLPFVSSKSDAHCYIEARRWSQAKQVPRWVFVKVPWEKKPFYVDFCSPLYVRMLAKQVRNALKRGVKHDTEIAISEMLPMHDQSWLTDADGNSYTSEMRIVAIHTDDLSRSGYPQ